MLLTEYSSRWVPRLDFRADPASRDLRNVRLSIISDEDIIRPPGWHINEDDDRYARDFGVIARGPNPFSEDHMVAIVAGRSSLGGLSRADVLQKPVESVGGAVEQLATIRSEFQQKYSRMWGG
jgi:hypothetical protein